MQAYDGIHQHGSTFLKTRRTETSGRNLFGKNTSTHFVLFLHLDWDFQISILVTRCGGLPTHLAKPNRRKKPLKQEKSPAPTENKHQSNCKLVDILVDQCHPHEANRATNAVDIAELADSIRAVGLISPIRVKKLGQGYQIIVGERCWRAHQRLGYKSISAFVYNSCEDAAIDTLRLVEQRTPSRGYSPSNGSRVTTT